MIFSITHGICDIDLTPKAISHMAIPVSIVGKFLGGRGVNAYFLFEHMHPEIDPLGPDNILMISTGLLAGTRAPASSRLHLNALSPSTGLLGSSNIGGDFGPRLRSCGIGSLILRGVADELSYLLIKGRSVQILNASSLGGLNTRETQERLKSFHGSDLEILAIGPAGENRVPIACVMSGSDHAAGRTGLGAVMGSKNLKAIAVAKGENQKRDENPAMREAVSQYAKAIRNAPEFKRFSTVGGAGYVKWCDDLGSMPTRNYRETRFEQAGRIDGERLRPYIKKRKGCNRCPVRCKADLKFDSGRFSQMPLARPEFEPMLTFGAKCGLADIDTLVFLDNLCSELGLDSISAGTAIGFAMDLFDRKIITAEDTGGLDLSWGNGTAMEELIREMALVEGFGGVLAQGVRKSAAIIGKGADELAPHVKGLEITAYNPRSAMGAALAYSICNRGGDFNNVYASNEHSWTPEKAGEVFGTPEAVNSHSPEGKGKLVARAAIVNAALDSLGICKVPSLSLIGRFDLELEAELASAITQHPFDAKTLFAAGERIVNLERLFNIRFGLRPEDDTLPEMFAKDEKLKIALEKMVRDFYDAMGWDKNGVPDLNGINEKEDAEK